MHNTFGERHSYLIPVDQPGLPIRQECAKGLDVSPFMDMALRYPSGCAPPCETLGVAIEGRGAMQPDRCCAGLAVARREALTDGALLRGFLRHPLLAAQVLAGIHWEAAKLWRKGMRVRPRPAPPAEPVSIVAGEGGMSGRAIAGPAPWGLPSRPGAAGAVLGRIEAGTLTVILPGGTARVTPAPRRGPRAVLVLHRWRALRRLATGGDIGFAEAYLDQDWSSPDPVALLELAARNMARVPGAEGGALPIRLWHRLRHLARANTAPAAGATSWRITTWATISTRNGRIRG